MNKLYHVIIDYMEMSEQYPEYESSIIFITNFEGFRILKAKGREVEEISEFENETYDGLVSELNEEALKFIREDPNIKFIITAPEILREELSEKLDKQILERMDEIVSKNLVALDLEAVVRILQEGK